MRGTVQLRHAALYPLLRRFGHLTAVAPFGDEGFTNRDMNGAGKLHPVVVGPAAPGVVRDRDDWNAGLDRQPGAAARVFARLPEGHAGALGVDQHVVRSEERRVGKEWRCRRWPACRTPAERR